MARRIGAVAVGIVAAAAKAVKDFVDVAAVDFEGVAADAAVDEADDVRPVATRRRRMKAAGRTAATRWNTAANPRQVFFIPQEYITK